MALRDDLGIRRFRFMTYWDEVEPENNRYKWGDLDYLLDESDKRGVKYTLAIGARQPRYPECHVPKWSENLGQERKFTELKEYLQKTVERYRDRPGLSGWQLENEALNRTFGNCPRLSRKNLREEFDLIKDLDRKHPVIINLSDQVGLPLGSPKGDIVGFSVYKKYYESQFFKRYFTYPWPPQWHSLRGSLIEVLFNRPVFIHELQAEPWGPKETKFMTIQEQDQSMSIQKLEEIVTYARQTKISPVDLWGSEWWYWRKNSLGDNTVWETVRHIYAN